MHSVMVIVAAERKWRRVPGTLEPRALLNARQVAAAALGNLAIAADHRLYFHGLLLPTRTIAGFHPMSRISVALRTALLFSVCAAPSALAAGEADKGDPNAGRALVYTCGGCHGVTGYRNAYPNYRVPRIAGQNYDYLVSALTEYKKGERAHPTMRAQGESMSDKDIRDIAAYLSSIHQ
jgi:cytochrome c553